MYPQPGVAVKLGHRHFGTSDRSSLDFGKNRNFQRVFTVMFYGRSQAEQPIDVGFGRRPDFRHRRSSQCHSPRLVKRQDLDTTEVFQVNAAFEQNALSPRACDRRQQHRRGTHHNRTRRSSHQQHHRMIESLTPGILMQHACGKKDDGRGRKHPDHIWLLPRFDETLPRRLLSLRLLHHMDDPLQSRVLNRAGHRHQNTSLPIDRAGKDLSSCWLGNLLTFPGQRGFVSPRLALADQPIHRKAFSGTHTKHTATHQGINRHQLFRIANNQSRLAGTKLNQRFDRPRRAVHGKGFQSSAERKQKQQDNSFKPVSQNRRP